MPGKLYLLMPLTSAVLYALGSMSLRASAQEGVGPWRATLLTNGLAAMGFLVYLRGSPWPELPEAWGAVGVMGLLFFFGNVFTVLALTYGDVSIATPVIGAKVVMVVAILALFSDGQAGWNDWVAGLFTLAGIALIQMRDRSMPPHHVLRTLGLALAAALQFAVFDVMVQEQSAEMGFHRVVPFAVGLAGILSLGLLPFCKVRYREINRRGKRFLWLGAGLIAGQAMILIFSLGTFQDAGSINVVYGSRGLWAVVAVWAVGPWFGNREVRQGPRVFRFRAAGAACILAGIGLVFAF